jgi:anti-sigma factor RsiW
MSKVVPLQASIHFQAERLLPWLLNGTLGEAQRELVERHLAACARCQEEARNQERLQALYLQLAAEPSSPPDFERLRRRLPGVEPSGPRAAWRAWRRRAVHAGWRAPPVLRWTAAACLLLATAVAVSPWRVAPEPTPAFRTLGTVSGAVPVGEQLVVVFDPALSEARMRTLLRASGARIVDGPSEAGAYVLVLPADRIAAVQAGLRDAPGVLLVERLQPPAER